MYQFSLHDRPIPEHWRNLAELWRISPEAKKRLEWMIFYHTIGKKNALKTARYFGIAPKTFHKWKTRFDSHRIQSLEAYSRAPKKKRSWQVTSIEEERIKCLRMRYMKYGKKKLKILYVQDYHDDISTWKIERVIRKHSLYPDPEIHHQRMKHIRRQKLKTRIHTMKQTYQGTM